MSPKKQTTTRARKPAAQPPKPSLVLVERPRVVVDTETPAGACGGSRTFRIMDGQLQTGCGCKREDHMGWFCLDTGSTHIPHPPQGLSLRLSRVRLLADLIKRPTEKVWEIAPQDHA